MSETYFHVRSLEAQEAYESSFVFMRRCQEIHLQDEEERPVNGEVIVCVQCGKDPFECRCASVKEA